LRRYFDPVVAAIEQRIAAVTGIAPHAHEDPIKISRYEPPATHEPRGSSPLLNMHHDRNAARPRRTATVIMYLRAPVEGGETFFPCCVPASPGCSLATPGVMPCASPSQPAASTASCISSSSSPSPHVTDEGGGDALGAQLAELYDVRNVTLIPSTLDEGGEGSGGEGGDVGALEATALAECERRYCCLYDDNTTAVAIAPRRGAAAVFWSVVRAEAAGAGVGAGGGERRQQADSVHGWHGAAHVRRGVKVAAQKFKEEAPPSEHDDVACVRELRHSPFASDQ
jgi:hypothetical protein